MASEGLFFSLILQGLCTLNLELQTFHMPSFSNCESEILMGKWAVDWRWCCP